MNPAAEPIGEFLSCNPSAFFFQISNYGAKEGRILSAKAVACSRSKLTALWLSPSKLELEVTSSALKHSQRLNYFVLTFFPNTLIVFVL